MPVTPAACDLSALPNKYHRTRSQRSPGETSWSEHSHRSDYLLEWLPRRWAHTVIALSKPTYYTQQVFSGSLSAEHPPFCSQLQQKALEVDSSRVSGAIQNLINSWKASDNQTDQDAATTSNGSQVSHSPGTGPEGKGKLSGSLAEPSEEPGTAQPADDEQQLKRNRLLSLFSRSKTAQQQPEEMMPVRVCHACSTTCNIPATLSRSDLKGHSMRCMWVGLQE